MQYRIGTFLFAVLFFIWVPRGYVSAKEGHGYEFFAFDNGVGRGQWTPERQAAVLKELGYDGISYNFTTTEALAGWLRAFDAQGLRIFGLYVPSWIGRPEHLPQGLEAAISLLQGRDTVIWLNMSDAKKAKGDSDEEAVQVIRQVASWAERAGLRVALYGHKDLYIETAEDGLRLVRKVKRKNVGCSINLCHELMYGNGDRLREIVHACARHLMLVSINGADPDGKPNGYIQTLDRGSYDVLPFLQELKQAGYKGPVGLQCYNVAGDIVENLKKSMGAWRSLQQRVFQQGER